ncbi:MAG TPA: acyl-CoA thioesterase domain-containing protein [Acidimicrobiales bacterium]|nr:acyl-CoA thioesterase domain-containing protein [Acidimicrobiales bacterium]
MTDLSWAAALRDLAANGDSFVAQPIESEFGRLFGGLVLAYGLAAAAATVDATKLPQSLHGYFVRGGQPGVAIDLDVNRLRDGRAFSTRRVTASQGGAVILEMLASFHVAEAGEDWHPPAPPRPGPHDSVPVPRMPEMSEHFEMRMIGEATMFSGPPYWIRVIEEVDDDPVTRACVLTFLSDMGLMAAARPSGLTIDAERPPEDQRPLMRNAASLDHSLWFHRPFDPNAWHRFEATKRNGNDARGLVTGSIYDADGTLVASVAQEALWRV